MVSGFFTSPFDHVRMSFAAARLMVSRLLSLTSSNGAPPSLYNFRNSETSARGVFLVGAPLGAREVDAERLGRAERVLVELADLDLLAGRVHHADVEAQRLHLLDEHLEALGDAGFGDVLALH